jgi:hypothetical protein
VMTRPPLISTDIRFSFLGCAVPARRGAGRLGVSSYLPCGVTFTLIGL